MIELSEQQTELETFADALKEQFEKGRSTFESLKKLKEKAWEKFLGLGLPTRQLESYQYIWLRSLFEQSYSQASLESLDRKTLLNEIYPESKESVLVFVNGLFQSELSSTAALPKGVVILPLSEAIKTYGAFLNQQAAKAQKEETDPFAALNGALYENGLFIYIPPKVVVKSPIQLLFISKGGKLPTSISPRVQVFCGAHSEASFISKQCYMNASSCWINQFTEFAVEENGSVGLVQVACGGSGFQFDATRATLKRNSRLKITHCTDGAQVIRHDYRVQLLGEGAEADLNGLWHLSGKRQAHTHVLVDHQAPHCRSLQLFKGILDDHSRSSFEGKIFVRQVAQKTDAFQLNNNLLLSDTAHADSKPNLEVYADDVKASHGATVGQLDSEQLFYMQARGFSKKVAEKMLVKSFATEIIDQIPVESVRRVIASSMSEREMG